MYTNSLSSFIIIRIALPAIPLACNLIIPWLNNSNCASYCVAKILSSHLRFRLSAILEYHVNYCIHKILVRYSVLVAEQAELIYPNPWKNSKWVWSGNTTITNCRQPRGTARNSRSTITRHQEDKLSKAISSLFPIKMIASLEWT